MVHECEPFQLSNGDLACPSGVKWLINFEQKTICEYPDPPRPASDRACVQVNQVCMKQVICTSEVRYREVDGQFVAYCVSNDYNGQSKTYGPRSHYTSDCQS